jgi:hypothetical protein
MDNLQVVFDRTDWAELAKQKDALSRAMSNDEEDAFRLHRLANWLDALTNAAKMDGFQTKEHCK